jgi:hypothetical protein
MRGEKSITIARPHMDQEHLFVWRDIPDSQAPGARRLLRAGEHGRWCSPTCKWNRNDPIHLLTPERGLAAHRRRPGQEGENRKHSGGPSQSPAESPCSTLKQTLIFG